MASSSKHVFNFRGVSKCISYLSYAIQSPQILILHLDFFFLYAVAVRCRLVGKVLFAVSATIDSTITIQQILDKINNDVDGIIDKLFCFECCSEKVVYSEVVR